MKGIKARIREEMQARPHPPPDIRRQVVEGVSRWLAVRSPRVVVGFLAMGDEIDITPLIEAHPSIRFGLTRTASGTTLTVHDYLGPRERHTYGFEQPSARAPRIDPEEVGVVLVPGLAFGRDGRRLGRGAGYYDRFLAGLEAERVGLTTSDRIRDDIPLEAHDVLMDWIATEKGVFAADH
ncbi:MAG: 5-formyltetrahydrofolate cyclo-ligase [Actinomycetota bacterium]